MKYKKSQEKKKEFDEVVALYLASKVFTSMQESDAYKEGIIDGVGNQLKQPNSTNDWAFTLLDKMILAFKQHFGEDKLEELLKNLKWVGDIDPLLITNLSKDSNLIKIRDCLRLIVTKVEDANYMPDSVEHKQEFLMESDDSFKNRVSFCITVATMLLYSLMKEEVPTGIDFEHNVMPSVELTFSITPCRDYEKCLEYIKKNNLVDSYGAITPRGIRLIVSVAKDAVSGDILNRKAEREENKYIQWEKLAKH